MERNTEILLCVYLAVSLIAFVSYGRDKRLARQHKWRTPEAVLLALGFFGGSVGALLGMQVFRHKTKHWYFVWGVPAILIAELALAAWWLFRYL